DDGDSNDGNNDDGDSNDGNNDDGDSNDGGGQAGGGGQQGGQQADQEPDPDPEPDIGQANVTLDREELLVDETLVAEATVVNRGNGSGTKTVEFEVEGEELETREIPLDPGEERTVAFSHEFTSPGTKSVEVDHGETYRIDVLPREPNIAVTDLAVDQSEVASGEEFTITANVTNDGAASGDETLALELFGDTVSTRTVSLDAGESTEVSFTRSVMAGGSYDATVGNESVTVVVQATETATPSTSTSTESPGLGVLSALVALAAAPTLWRRRG
ncbi:MAG: CARDB domain-containing protein, partial [Halolamina sp.]